MAQTTGDAPKEDAPAPRARGTVLLRAQEAPETNEGPMTVGIVGLGLIGGSFAKAYREAGWRVLAYDVDDDAMAIARIETIDGTLDATTAGSCDLILLCVYPGAAIDWLTRNADNVGAGAIVIDCCGVKAEVVHACMPLAEGRPFTYVGGHPMAGTQYSGFKYARANLYHGAPMVIVPPRTDDAALHAPVMSVSAGSSADETSEDSPAAEPAPKSQTRTYTGPDSAPSDEEGRIATVGFDGVNVQVVPSTNGETSIT